MMNSFENEILSTLMQDVEASEQYKEALELRLVLLRNEAALKSEYELNEREILRMKTIIGIDKMRSVIFERKEMFRESFARYIEELEFEDKNIK
jgi:hypothetical protein